MKDLEPQPSDVDKQTLVAWLKNEDRTADELSVACGRYVEADRVIASHRNASAELLSRLSHSSDRAIRARVTSHPATPSADFVRLGQQFPTEFLASPQLDLLLLENPALLQTLPVSTLVRLLKTDRCPVEALVWAASHPDESVQLAVLACATAPAAALKLLQTSIHGSVRSSAAARSLPEAEDSRDPEEFFKGAVKARLAELPPGSAIEAWKSGDIGLPQWPYLSPAVRLEVLGVEWTTLVNSAFLPRPVWEELYVAAEYLCELVSSPSAPPDRVPALLKSLLKHPDGDVRGAVARHPALELDQLQGLLEDPRSDVVACAASNPRVPIQELLRLGTSDEKTIRIAVARNPTAPVHLLDRLLSDPSPYVRAAACANATIPKSIATQHLSVLIACAHDDASLAQSVMANALVTPEQMQELIQAFKSQPWALPLVYLAAAENPSSSSAFLLSLFDLKIQGWTGRLKKTIAIHPNTPLDLLCQLVNGPYNELRLAALANPSLPSKMREATLQELIGIAPSPVGNVWTQQRTSKASPDEVEAARQGAFMHYCGKDPNKAVLAKRPIAALMAMCSGPYVEPSRIARIVSSTDWLVRAAIARNPGTPPNLIKKLGSDANEIVAALAKTSRGQPAVTSPSPQRGDAVNSQLSAPSLRVVDEITKRLRDGSGLEHLLTDPVWGEYATGTDVWTMLPEEAIGKIAGKLSGTELELFWTLGASAKTEDVRERVAAHTSCPIKTLEALTSDKSLNVLLNLFCNPTLTENTRLMLEGSLTRLRGEKLSDLVRSQNVSSGLLARLSDNSDRAVRAAVARHDKTPVSILDKLAADSDSWVRTSVAENQNASPEILKRLSSDTKPEVRKQVARNRSCAAEILDSLHNDKDIGVLCGVADNRNASEATIRKLFHNNNKDVSHRLAANPSTPTDLLEALAQDQALMGAIAWNTGAPLAIRQKALEAEAGSDEWVYRQNVAKCNDTAASVLESLSLDPESAVRRGVASNPQTPLKVLEKLSEDSDRWVRHEVARNPSTPMAVRQRLFDALARDDAWNLRCDMAESASTPPDTLESLAMDEDVSVRIGVAANRATPSATLVALSADPEEQVRRAAATNPSAPAEVRHGFMDGWVNRMITAVRRELNAKEGEAPGVASSLKDADVVLALTWAGCIEASPDNKALTKASRSKDWLARLAVALHPQSTTAQIKLLSQDADADVAESARRRLRTFQA